MTASELHVYVPYEGTITNIKPGSAICGRAEAGFSGHGLNEADLTEGRLCLYYEGNLYGSSSMTDWKTMLFHAADRLLANYPTVARCWVRPSEWCQVAWYNHALQVLDVEDRQTLDAWIASGRHAPHPARSELVELWKETR